MNNVSNNYHNRRITKIKVNNDLYAEEDFLKDCPDYSFVPIVLPAVERIIAIGDIHGDLNLAIRSFKLGNLIDDNMNWVANPPNTIVVQVGDQIDSCRPVVGVYDCHNEKQLLDKADDMNVINFFDIMHQKAKEKGGAVYSLFGNHELMNSQQKFDYVSYENFNSFNYKSENGTVYAGPNGRRNAFKPGGPVANELACTRISVIIIGSTMFVHAGVLPILVTRLDHLNVDANTKLRYLNAIIRKWLLNKLSDKEGLKYKKMFVDDDKLSPFWTRVYGMIPEETKLGTGECFHSVNKILQVYKIGHIVVGHTPQLFLGRDGINGTCFEKNGDNKLFRIDGGFAEAFKIFGDNDTVQILEILNDTEFNIIRDTNIYKYVAPPKIDINEQQIKIIAPIYSQNRIDSTKRIKKHKKYKKKLFQ